MAKSRSSALNTYLNTWVFSQKGKPAFQPHPLLLYQNINFIEQCLGKNDEYEKWYSQMVESLTEKELPYAYDDSDYFYPTDYWLTTENKKIVTLSKGH